MWHSAYKQEHIFAVIKAHTNINFLPITGRFIITILGYVFILAIPQFFASFHNLESSGYILILHVFRHYQILRKLFETFVGTCMQLTYTQLT